MTDETLERRLQAGLQRAKEFGAAEHAALDQQSVQRQRNIEKIALGSGDVEDARWARILRHQAEQRFHEKLHIHRRYVLRRRAGHVDALPRVMSIEPRAARRTLGHESRPAARRAAGIRAGQDPGDDEPEHPRGDLHRIGPAVAALVDSLEIVDYLKRAA